MKAHKTRSKIHCEINWTNRFNRKSELSLRTSFMFTLCVPPSQRKKVNEPKGIFKLLKNRNINFAFSGHFLRYIFVFCFFFNIQTESWIGWIGTHPTASVWTVQEIVYILSIISSYQDLKSQVHKWCFTCHTLASAWVLAPSHLCTHDFIIKACINVTIIF